MFREDLLVSGSGSDSQNVSVIPRYIYRTPAAPVPAGTSASRDVFCFRLASCGAIFKTDMDTKDLWVLTWFFISQTKPFLSSTFVFQGVWMEHCKSSRVPKWDLWMLSIGIDTVLSMDTKSPAPVDTNETPPCLARQIKPIEQWSKACWHSMKYWLVTVIGIFVMVYDNPHIAG